MLSLYDRISDDYADLRRPDPAIERQIRNALADADTVVNVGAGTGSYEPTDRLVIAVEPSWMMIRKRAGASQLVVQGTATSLPLRSKSVDAALAVLTVHHWPDRIAGLKELRRVTRDRIVIFTWDPSHIGFWLNDYLPEVLSIDRPLFPTMEDFERVLGPVSVEKVEVPHDCSDGFLCAYWRRPEAYLDPRVRSAISTFSKLANVEEGLEALGADLRSGSWKTKYGDLLSEASLDLGYRLVVSAGG